ncbi:hypothetical protein ACQQ32_005690 [Pseudomonas aeruginosa]
MMIANPACGLAVAAAVLLISAISEPAEELELTQHVLLFAQDLRRECGE